MSTYKIGVLQQALDESVPATELESANKQYNELTAKYRDIIQRENSLVARSAIVDNLEVRFVCYLAFDSLYHALPNEQIAVVHFGLIPSHCS